MEKDDVTLFHLKVDAGGLHIVVAFDTEVRLVDLSLPLWVDVSQEFSLMGPWEDIQGSILFVGVLERSPSRDNLIGWPEREIGQILMERMP